MGVLLDLQDTGWKFWEQGKQGSRGWVGWGGVGRGGGVQVGGKVSTTCPSRAVVKATKGSTQVAHRFHHFLSGLTSPILLVIKVTAMQFGESMQWTEHSTWNGNGLLNLTTQDRVHDRFWETQFKDFWRTLRSNFSYFKGPYRNRCYITSTGHTLHHFLVLMTVLESGSHPLELHNLNFQAAQFWGTFQYCFDWFWKPYKGAWR